jgi:hypothetical protein
VAYNGTTVQWEAIPVSTTGPDYTISGNVTTTGNLSVGAVTLSGGTTNGVAYLNGSNVITTGSALTFDGTVLTSSGFSGPLNGTVGATTANTGSFTTLSASSTVSGTGFSTYLASPPAIGATTQNTGAFTTLSASAVGSTIELKQTATGAATYYVMDNTIETGGKRWRFGYTGAAGIPCFSLYNQTDNLVSWVADASGNFGLGITPSAWTVGKNIQIGAAGIISGQASNTSLIEIGANWYYGASGAIKYINSDYASDYYQYQGKHIWWSAPSGTAGATVTTSTNMTLDASGNLLVGTTTSAGRLTVKGTTTDNSTTGITVQDSSANSLFYVRNDGLVNTGISTNSPYNATTASPANLLVTSSGSLLRATSALKYKQDVRNLENVDISIFRPVRYKSKCYLDNSTNDYIGFIADEYVDHYPELVSFGSEGQVEGFAYERMTAILCKAIQELSAQVTTLQTQVTALKG